MYKIGVFAGTAEGRQLVEFLAAQQVQVRAFVATEYGETLLTPAENLEISAGRMDEDQLRQLFSEEAFDLVIDATHPYATCITENLISACRETETSYQRLLREAGEAPEDAVFVESVGEAASYLASTEGTVLLTTGSKELAAFREIPDFSDRCYARVLPMEESLALCREAGLKPAHIFAMQGPFSAEMNVAMLRAVHARWLVTKESGRRGGFDQKLEAARQAGARLVVIGRPPQTAGKSFAQIIPWLCGKFGFSRIPEVSVVGIGPGSRELLTGEAEDAISHADCLIGAKRMTESVKNGETPCFSAIAPAEIVKIIRENPQVQKFAVLMSGDTGFYSGTKKLLPLLSECKVQVLPGISSKVYLCARLGVSHEDVISVSLHGRTHNLCAELRSHRRLFVLVGGENGVAKLCQSLCDGGFGSVKVSVGERLSYPEEKITIGTAEELKDGVFDSLSAALVENEGTLLPVIHGLPDEAFLRGGSTDAVVPMTKSEVRSVCLSKLALTRESVCWDVGAGTGSVAIEMALQATDGAVYAIERREDALALLEENRQKFAADNLTVVAGTAPEILRELPAPSHVFIGGSGGHMQEILAIAREKNPAVRIVATAIALETVAELTACQKDFEKSEICSLTVARSRRAGPYHLMTGQNPIYIFTMQGGKNR